MYPGFAAYSSQLPESLAASGLQPRASTDLLNFDTEPVERRHRDDMLVNCWLRLSLHAAGLVVALLLVVPVAHTEWYPPSLST